MQNATLFAGAGFSRAVSRKVKYYGDKKKEMPLVNEMFTGISFKQYSRNRQAKYGELGDFLEQHKKYKNRFPKVSYEGVYETLKEERKNELATELENLVIENIGVNYPPIRHPCEIEQTTKIIRDAIKLNEINSIITTNPDLLIDVAVMGASEFDRNFINLFGSFKNNKIKLFHPENWHPVVGKKDNVKMLEIHNFIKVHGSINYAKESSNPQIYLLDTYQWNSGISAGIFRLGGRFEICVIAPLKKKDYSNEPWRSLVEAATEVLSNSDKVIFFGFRFSENDESLEILFEKIKPDAEIKIYDIQACNYDYRGRILNECLKQVKNGNIKFESDVEIFFRP